ncbi:MAG: Rsd/AlgQ family anti-sigma factor [Gammaproteobacteria bacterium]|nr:MAG: Rsd/AlgQ family anti-sigma factor [Gammaproteobacteria bacterium]
MGMSSSVETSTDVRERRNSSYDVIKRLLAERAEMLALFCRTAGVTNFENDDPRSSQALLQEFCQVLVDYIASGHFGLYERIVNGQERRNNVAKLAEKLYPRIAETTQVAVDFNDKYDCEDYCDMSDSLESDLSFLGEQLATRIELEDQLIQAIMRPKS